VIGENYHTQRDALMDAIDKAGAATLVHPYLGTMRVDVLDARQREDSQHGGRCQFTLTLVIAGKNKYPDQQIDTQAVVDAQANLSLIEIKNDFINAFNAVGLVAAHAQELEAELDQIITLISGQIGSVLEPITSLIYTPASLATALLGSVSKISAAASSPTSAFKLYRPLLNSDTNSPSIPATTASRIQQTTSAAAVHALVKRSALVEAARVSSQIDYLTYDDAITMRNVLLDELDVQMRTDDVSDVVFNSLLDLRAAVVNDIRTRGADLSRLSTHVAQAVQPALVIAHQLYGDANREAELISRNNIHHAGFMPASEPLEVLNV